MTTRSPSKKGKEKVDEMQTALLPDGVFNPDACATALGSQDTAALEKALNLVNNAEDTAFTEVGRRMALLSTPLTQLLRHPTSTVAYLAGKLFTKLLCLRGTVADDLITPAFTMSQWEFLMEFNRSYAAYATAVAAAAADAEDKSPKKGASSKGKGKGKDTMAEFDASLPGPGRAALDCALRNLAIVCHHHPRMAMVLYENDLTPLIRLLSHYSVRIQYRAMRLVRILCMQKVVSIALLSAGLQQAVLTSLKQATSGALQLEALLVLWQLAWEVGGHVQELQQPQLLVALVNMLTVASPQNQQGPEAASAPTPAKSPAISKKNLPDKMVQDADVDYARPVPVKQLSLKLAAGEVLRARCQRSLPTTLQLAKRGLLNTLLRMLPKRLYPAPSEPPPAVAPPPGELMSLAQEEHGTVMSPAPGSQPQALPGTPTRREQTEAAQSEVLQSAGDEAAAKSASGDLNQELLEALKLAFGFGENVGDGSPAFPQPKTPPLEPELHIMALKLIGILLTVPELQHLLWQERSVLQVAEKLVHMLRARKEEPPPPSAGPVGEDLEASSPRAKKGKKEGKEKDGKKERPASGKDTRPGSPRKEDKAQTKPKKGAQAEVEPEQPAAHTPPFSVAVQRAALEALAPLCAHASLAAQLLRDPIMVEVLESLHTCHTDLLQPTAELLHRAVLAMSPDEPEHNRALAALKALGLRAQAPPEPLPPATYAAITRALLALPEESFIAPARPPPPSPPPTPPPPPLATSQFVWDALGRPDIVDGLVLGT